MFHPAPLGEGETEGTMVRTEEFRMTWMGIDVAFPATSVASTLMVLEPWVRVMLQERLEDETVAAAPLQVTGARPESASVTVPVTVI